MFDMRHLNFANGVYTDGVINGAEVAIMTSRAYTDILVKDLKDAVDRGYDPNDVMEDIMEQRHIDYDDLSDVDKQYIKYEIENYVKWRDLR